MASLLGIVLTAPFAGGLTARMKAKSCLSCALLILAGLMAATASSAQTIHLLAVRLALGTTVPFIMTTCLALTARAASEKERSAWIGCYVIGAIAGGGMSRFLPGFLIGHLGWQAGFWVCAMLVLLVFMLTVFSRRITFVLPAPLPPAIPSKQLFLRAFSDRNLQLACLLGCALLFSQSAVLVALGLHLSLPRFGLTTGQIGMVYLAFLPASLAVAFSPRLHERMPARWLAACLLAGLWLAQPLIGSDALPWVAAGVAFFSIAAYIAQTGTARLVSHVRKLPVALASGIYLSSYYLGGAAGACLSAYAYAIGAWPGVWALLAGAQLCVAGVVLLCGRRKDLPLS